MELAKTKKLEKSLYKVKDISLSDWGRKEIALAEAEMPGLMSYVKNMLILNLWKVLALLDVCT
tara:strand:+ start:69 stop:257 length:189 start_codon:yes stop_codon:yes gene_type:complete